VTWGLVPLLFQLIGHMGSSAWEILAHRIVWGAPAGLAIVLCSRQGRAAVAAFRDPRTLGSLALSAGLIAVNWSLFIWAVNSGRVLETSLGYFILPLLMMVAGALLFGERLGRIELVAIALAAVGVVLQTLALGHLPWISLALAVSFGAYGVVRKRISADAQTGFLVECALLAVPALSYILWLQAQGGGHFGGGLALSALLVASGPITAMPLVLFAWAARRIPFSTMGFLQFIAPTLTFFMGVMQGEALSALRGASFGLIWAGVAVFALAAWRRARRLQQAVEQLAAAE
jgi:chloramphenicol-sensitive protein RarD